MQEVKARDGMVIAIATEGDDASIASRTAPIDDLAARRRHRWLAPIVTVAAAAAPRRTTSPCRRGSDVDQPRNLAKSVTVE